jgi:ABC-2 type transport system ATP-binding protein
MKQKLGLICALIHTPQILFLDEPTTGVDPLSRRDFWVILYDLLKEGVTILFSTSYLDEAERCSRIGMIHQGELLIADTPSVVKAQMKGEILELRTESNQRSLRMLEGVESLRGFVLAGDKIHILVDDSKEGERVVRDVLKAKGVSILDLMVVRPSLEDAFVSIVKERKNNQDKMKNENCKMQTGV